MDTENLDNAPVLVTELDRIHAASGEAGQDGQIAVWQAASRLGLWFFVNRGTPDSPTPYAVQPPGMGPVICIYSCRHRAREAATQLGQDASVVLPLPTPRAIDYLESLAPHGVAGVVLDKENIGIWSPLGNLSRMREWLVPQTIIGRAPREEN
jgi:hypothetical protein